MSHQIVVVGSLNADEVIDVPHLPLAGDTVIGHGRLEVGWGGKGANQAAAAATFADSAGSVAMVGCVGRDDRGRAMVADLATRGVDVDAVREADVPSGRAVIAVDPHGQNLILVDAGANGDVRTRDVLVERVAEAAVVLLQLEVPVEVAVAAAEHATGLVILNPAPAHGAAGALDAANVVVPNLTELAELTGCRPAEDDDEAARQARLLDTRADVVVTLGARGALVVEAAGHVELVAGTVVDAVDTTGAGDCFCGVLAVELAEGAALVAAVRVAVAAATLSVTGAGARGRLPTRAETLESMRSGSS